MGMIPLKSYQMVRIGPMTNETLIISAPDFYTFWSDMGRFQHYALEMVEKNFLRKHRSSTIFPLYIKNGSSVQISFLSYWINKHGTSVAMKLTIRDKSGHVSEQSWMPILELKAFNIPIMASALNRFRDEGFVGSVEVEIYSKSPPRFTFPALTLIYQNAKSLSAVHSCIRTYNDDEICNDYALNFPQTGFDLSISKQQLNYFCFIGGGKENYSLTLTLRIGDSVIEKAIYIAESRYGKLHNIIIEDVLELGELAGEGKLSIEHDLDIFPRFYAGIITNDNVPTLTHSYFDTSGKYNLDPDVKKTAFRAVNKDAAKYFDSAFMIPVMPSEEYITELKNYDQNLSFSGSVFFKVYGENASLLYEESSLSGTQKWLQEWGSFNVSEFLFNRGISSSQVLGFFIGFKSLNSAFPLRFKLGLNIRKSLRDQLGTNICFAALVQNIETIEKPFTRNWFPLGGDKNVIACLHATDFRYVSLNENREINLKFINHLGDSLERVVPTPLNGSILIDKNLDEELNLFLSDELGWCFSSVEHYVVNAYYFSTEGDQIGGDHAY